MTVRVTRSDEDWEVCVSETIFEKLIDLSVRTLFDIQGVYITLNTYKMLPLASCITSMLLDFGTKPPWPSGLTQYFMLNPMISLEPLSPHVARIESQAASIRYTIKY
jgi:hypothetical protein